MPDNRPITPTDQFLMRQGYQPSAPVDPQQVAQQEQRQPTPSRAGFTGARYFLPPDPERGRTWVVPAGTSGMTVENPLPDRPTFESEMAERTALAWEVERQNRLSGSSTVSNARAVAREGWEPHLVRDSSGRLRTDWSRVGADLPHDPAGRPYPTTEVDNGIFRPGQDIF